MFVFEADHVVQARFSSHGIERRLRLARSRSGGICQTVAQSLDVRVEPFETLLHVAPIHVAKGDNVLARKVDEVLTAHAANADAGDVQHIAWRSESSAQNMPRDQSR